MLLRALLVEAQTFCVIEVSKVILVFSLRVMPVVEAVILLQCTCAKVDVNSDSDWINRPSVRGDSRNPAGTVGSSRT